MLCTLHRLGSTCNHVAALLFEVEYAWQYGLTQGCKKSCTSTSNQWIAPTLANLEPIKAKDMIIKKPHFRARPEHSGRVDDSTVSRQLFSSVRSEKDTMPLSLDDIASAVFPDCPNSVALRYSHVNAQSSYEPYADVNVALSTDTTATREVTSVDIIEYAKQFVNVSSFIPPFYSTEDLENIEKQTKRQSESPMWIAMRKDRISASIAHDVVTRMHSLQHGKTTDCSNLLSLIIVGSQVNPDLPASKYGRDNEVRAVDKYIVTQCIHHRNSQVENAGLFVDSVNTFLCASPDRLVSYSCCGEGLLEVKCPLSIAGQDPQKASLPFLVDSNVGRALRTNHKYYTQVQMQMALTKRQWCDFFVFSEGGCYLQR